jgi:hypothetical protein
MNDYCFHVTCPIEPFKDPNFPLEILKTDSYRHSIIDRFRYINPELFAWYKELGVKINMVEVIYRPAHNVGDIHVDRGIGDKIKMNWIYGQSDNSHMNWFDYDPEYTTVAGTTNVNTPYITFPDDKCTKIYGQQVLSPSVCQTGIAHNITNGATSRLCISVDLLELSTMQGITFARAQEIFKDYLVW